jgi:hypothetical protein
MKACELDQRLPRVSPSDPQVYSGLHLEPEAMIAEENEGVRLAEAMAFAKVREEPDHWFLIRDKVFVD